jgi:hypothetical protein
MKQCFLLLTLLYHNANCQNIPKYFRKTNVFLSAVKSDSDVELAGTGFAVIVPDSNTAFGYLVTAKHVIQDTLTKQFYPGLEIRYNTIDGGFKSLRFALVDRGLNKNVYTHEDPSVDIAVIPLVIDQAHADINYCLETDLFKSEIDFDTSYIKEGTNLFYTGLFSSYIGYKQNSPITRFGKVSLIPNEKIEFKSSEPKAKLILAETTTFGGNSGSPVYAYGSSYRIWSGDPKDPINSKEQNNVHIYLLGIIKGYFDENSPVQFNNTAIHPIYSTNVGITGIIPSYFLYEILEGKELKVFRKKILKNKP